jgi:hypothetical protein
MIRRPLRTCGLGSRVLSCEMLSRPGHDTLRGLGGTSFLPSDEQNRQSDFTAKRQSTEINDFLCASTLRTPSSVDLGWKNFAVERRTILPCEKPAIELRPHFLVLSSLSARTAPGKGSKTSCQQIDVADRYRCGVRVLQSRPPHNGLSITVRRGAECIPPRPVVPREESIAVSVLQNLIETSCLQLTDCCAHPRLHE